MAGEKCATCNGCGMLSTHAGDGSWDDTPCPDCNAPSNPVVAAGPLSASSEPAKELTDEQIEKICEPCWREAEEETDTGSDEEDFSIETEWTRYGIKVARAVIAAITPTTHPAGVPLSEEQIAPLERSAFAATNDTGSLGLFKHWWKRGLRDGEAAHGIATTNQERT